MPVFELSTPDGKSYEVTAPDMGTAVKALGDMAPPSVGDLSLRNVATAAARGVPVLGGLVDEAVAGGQALFGHGDYEGNLKAEQERQQAFDEQHPYVSGAAQLAGGVVGTLPMVAAAPAAFGAGAATLAGRVGLSALSSGVIGGADQAVRSNGDLVETAKGAGAGILFGGAAPFAGSLATKAYGRAADMAEQYLGNPSNALTGIPKEAVDYALSTVRSPERGRIMAQDLQRLGPEAMPADVSPEWLGVARGAASRPGQRDAIVNSVLERDAGKNVRLGADLDASLGKPVVPSRVDAGLEESQRALGPDYGEAFRYAQTPDTQSLAYELDDLSSVLRGPAQKAVGQVRRMLNVPGTNVLDPEPTALFQTRQAIDGLLSTEKDPKVIQHLTAVRQQVDDVLADAVPGLKAVDAQYSELARQQEGLKRGSMVLSGEKTAIRPQEMAEEFPAAALPQGQQVGPSAVPFRIQQGTRADIDRLVGQASNDPAKLQQVVKSEGDWNRDKLRTVFGQDRADKALSAIDRETVFYRTKNRIENGSDTAMTNRFGDFLDAAAKPNAIPTDTTMTGAAARGVQKVAQAILESDGEAKAAKFAADLGRLATARGAERDKAIKAIIDALERQNIRIPRSAGVARVADAMVRASGLQIGEAVGSR